MLKYVFALTAAVLAIAPDAMAQDSKVTAAVRGQNALEFLALQSTMAGAAGACSPEVYPLIRSCSVRLVERTITSLKGMGVEGLRAADSVREGADKIWSDGVEIGRRTQLGGAAPMSCAEVLEKVRIFGAQACVVPKNPRDLQNPSPAQTNPTQPVPTPTGPVMPPPMRIQ